MSAFALLHFCQQVKRSFGHNLRLVGKFISGNHLGKTDITRSGVHFHFLKHEFIFVAATVIVSTSITVCTVFWFSRTMLVIPVIMVVLSIVPNSLIFLPPLRDGNAELTRAQTQWNRSAEAI